MWHDHYGQVDFLQISISLCVFIIITEADPSRPQKENSSASFMETETAQILIQTKFDQIQENKCTVYEKDEKV